MIHNLSIQKLFSRLTKEDIQKLDDIVPSLEGAYVDEWQKLGRNTPRWKALTLRFCTHHVPESRARTHLSEKIPAPGIHMMQRADTWFVGDFYSADMTLECLAQTKLGLAAGGNYLDFGCSSGSMVRVLAAVEPEANCYGVDPVGDSIDWANENLPYGRFAVSNQRPPLDFEDNFFSGVSAISIWSHFSEPAALDWFNEMARIIKPGGWLFFTTHGRQTMARARKDQRFADDQIERIEASLDATGYHFKDMFGNEKHFGLETADWGNAYFSPAWLTANLSSQWHMRLFLEGRNQNNQDCYVLVRR